mgnify:FL=1
MASITNALTQAKDFNEKNIGFTEPKVKDGRFNGYITNPELDNNANLYILTDPILTSYGLSEYTAKEGEKPSYSIVVKNKSLITEYQNSANNLFNKVNVLTENLKDYFLKHNHLMLNAKDASKLKKKPEMVQAWVNNCIKQDKNEQDEIKLKIRSDFKTGRPVLQSLTVEKIEIKDDKKVSIEKKKINLNDSEDPWSVLRENIKPGYHIQAVIKPSIYWFGNRFGITFNIESLMVMKTASTIVDISASDLNSNDVNFSPIKKNKDGKGYSALVLNSSKNSIFGKIKTEWAKTQYGISSYENKITGEMDYSTYIKNISDIPESVDDVNNFFEFSEGINEKGIDYIMEYKDTIFGPSEAKSMTRDIAESVNFNPCVTQDKNNEDQIKFKIIKNDDGNPSFTCFEYSDFNDEESKKEVDWNSCENVWEDIKKIVPANSHIRVIVQPRIYFISSKVGINYKLSELHVYKNNGPRQDFNDVFSFTDDKAVEDNDKAVDKADEKSNDEEAESDEDADEDADEEIEIDEDEDSDAYGSD